MELVLSLPSGAHLNDEAPSNYQILGGTKGVSVIHVSIRTSYKSVPN